MLLKYISFLQTSRAIYRPITLKSIRRMSHTNSAMSEIDIDDKCKLITRNLEEVIGMERIRPILQERSMKVYWGTATTGRPHIAYFVPLVKIADFLAAGCEVTILLADLHALLDNLKAPWALVEQRVLYYKELIITMLKSINVPVDKLKFVKGTDYQLTKEYMLDVYKMATLSTLHDCRKAGCDVVKQVEHPLLSSLLYPGLQALDEEYLQVDAQFGGLDQRKIFTYAEKILPQVGYKKRIHLMNPMVEGLSGGKMSSSDPDSKIDLIEENNSIKTKVMKAFCEEGNIERNGVLSFCKFVIFPVIGRYSLITEFKVERTPEHGGNITFKTYEELERSFATKALHPQDLKKSVASYIQMIISPIRERFNEPELKKLVSLAYPKELPKTEKENNDVSELFMQVGLVKKAFNHPQIPSLNLFEVDVGAEESVLVSESVSTIEKSMLLNKKVVVVTNISPVKIGDYFSSGLILFSKFLKMNSTTPTYVELSPPDSCALGDKVNFTNQPNTTGLDVKIKLKSKVFNKLKENTTVNDEGVIECFDGELYTEKGLVKSALKYASLHINIK